MATNNINYLDKTGLSALCNTIKNVLSNSYASKTHTHTEYAASNHSHSEYALSSHTHSEYAASNHSHSDMVPTSRTINGQPLTQNITLISCGTTDLIAGSSTLAAGTLYGVYES